MTDSALRVRAAASPAPSAVGQALTQGLKLLTDVGAKARVVLSSNERAQGALVVVVVVAGLEAVRAKFQSAGIIVARFLPPRTLYTRTFPST